MLNVQNITAKLASLPDQALQQYAAMNKDDPYIMSLAMSESNRRKQIRAAQQSQGMQEQPTVVDQALQEMAQPMPEDVGIAQLPAGEMEFAGGGILAFAQGDSIPGPKQPQYGSGVAFGGSIENWRRMLQGQQPDYTPPAPVQLTDAERKEYERKKELGGFGMALEWLQKKFDVDANNARIIAEGTEKRLGLTPKGAAEARTEFAQNDPRRVVPDVATGEDAAAADAAAVGPTTPAAPTGLAQIAPPKAAVAADVGPMDIKGKLEELKPFYKDIDNKPAEDIAKAQGAKETEFAKKAVEAEKKLQAELGEYGVGREKRLKEREAKLSQDEKSNYGLAFLEAGLAMMGGESPNAFANISKGALQGMGSYKKGLASLAESKEKLFDAYDALEKDRRSDKIISADRLQQKEAAVVAAEGRLSDKLFTLATDKGKADADTARALATASIGAAATEWSAKQRAAEGAADRQTRVDVARYDADVRRAIAEMPSAELQKLAALDPTGKGNARAGYEEQQRIIAQYSSEGKFNLDKAYSEYLNKNEPAAKLSGQKLLTKGEYAAMFGQGFVKPTETDTVRKPKG